MTPRLIDWFHQGRRVSDQALRWWLGQLASLMPQRLRSLLQPRRPVLVIDADDDFIVIGRLTTDGYREISRLGVSEPPDRAIPIVSRALHPRSDIVVRLPASQVLVKRLPMAAATLPNLRRILAYDLDRHVPFTGSEVYFDYRMAPPKAAGWIEVELAVAPRSAVADAVALARRFGLVPTIVGMASSNGLEAATFNFLPDESVKSRTRPIRMLEYGLAGAVFFCAAACGIVWSARQQTAIAVLSAKIAAARTGAQAADRLQHDFRQLSDRVRFIALKRQQQPFVRVLTELTHVLPDDTWVFDLQLNGEEGRISGFSPTASGLIGLLEKSSYFGAAQFRAPVTLGPQSGLERFDVSFRLRNETAP